MTDRFRIRPSTADDLPHLLDIWRRAVAATHDFLTPQDRAEIDHLVAEHYLPDAELLVAVDGDDHPLGFLGGTGRNIDALFVDPDAHGRGIGSLLVERFSATGEGPLTVDVNEQNASGSGFYAARGFRRVGRSELDEQGRPYPLCHLVRDAQCR